MQHLCVWHMTYFSPHSSAAISSSLIATLTDATVSLLKSQPGLLDLALLSLGLLQFSLFVGASACSQPTSDGAPEIEPDSS